YIRRDVRQPTARPAIPSAGLRRQWHGQKAFARHDLRGAGGGRDRARARLAQQHAPLRARLQADRSRTLSGYERGGGSSLASRSLRSRMAMPAAVSPAWHLAWAMPAALSLESLPGVPGYSVTPA